MELMDKSLDKLCHLVYNRLGEVIPELMVGKMAEAVSGQSLISLCSKLFLYRHLKLLNIFMMI